LYSQSANVHLVYVAGPILDDPYHNFSSSFVKIRSLSSSTKSTEQQRKKQTDSEKQTNCISFYCYTVNTDKVDSELGEE